MGSGGCRHPGLSSRDARTPGWARLSRELPGAEVAPQETPPPPQPPPPPSKDGAPTFEMQHVVGDGDVRVLQKERKR